LKVIDGPRIIQIEKYAWRVIATIEDGYPKIYYLHNDKKWRLDGDYCVISSSIFRTEDNAKKALEEYIRGA
jgi:hypothetical protein